MTHTATPCAMSGSGGPNVAPLIDPAPTAPMTSQTGFVLASHPERQTFSVARGSTGKLCEMPVHPLSRSVPVSAGGKPDTSVWLTQSATEKLQEPPTGAVSVTVTPATVPPSTSNSL